MLPRGKQVDVAYRAMKGCVFAPTVWSLCMRTMCWHCGERDNWFWELIVACYVTFEAECLKKKKKKQATGTLSHREKSVRGHGLFIQVKCCRKIVRRGFVIPVRGRRSHEMLRWNCNASTVPSLCWKHDFINKDIQLDLEKHERAWLGIKKWYTRLIINKILCLNGQLCVIC